MNPVFQSAGLSIDELNYRPLEIAGGETRGWRVETHDDCHRLLDIVTGLAEAPRGAVVWFGCDMATLTQNEILAVLQRIMPLTPDGGLISNVNTAENILLPLIHRNPRSSDEARQRLENLLGAEPWRRWFPAERLRELPHKLNPLAHALASILRAWVANPEAVIACDMRHALDSRAAETVTRALAWLRSETQGAAWLVIQTESALPGGMAGNIIEPLA